MTQNEAIVERMKTEWMSPLKAAQYFDCYRFSGRVFDIKAMGYDLEERDGHNPNTGKRWKEFRIRRNEEVNGQGVLL
jgi:hypothetical protein